jgi:hypothetical protein
MSDVTRILSAIEQGDPRAAEQLLPLVYEADLGRRLHLLGPPHGQFLTVCSGRRRQPRAIQ